MSKKLQFALACIILGILCITSVYSCTIAPHRRWGYRTPLNKEWLGYRLEKKYAARDIHTLHTLNLCSKMVIKQARHTDHIIVKTEGLPDETLEIALNNGTLHITEKDVWQHKRREAAYSWFNDWYIDSEIVIELPKDKHLTAMQLEPQRSVQLDTIEADTVQVIGEDSAAFRTRHCTFDSLISEGEIRIDMTDTAIKSRCSVNSKDGSIKLNTVSAPIIEIHVADGSLKAQGITTETFICQMKDGSCKIEGTISKRVSIISEDGSVSLDLNGGAVAEAITVQSKDSSIILQNLTAPAADIQTQNSSIRMQHVQYGVLQCHTDDGPIQFNGVVSKNAAFTSNDGSITADFNGSTLSEQLSLQSRDGNISIQNVSAPQTTIKALDGQLKVSQSILQNLTAETNGSIIFDGDLGGSCRLFSKNGNIQLHLQKPEHHYAVYADSGSSKGTAQTIGNITIEGAKKHSEPAAVIAGNSDAPNKLFLSAENGKIRIKTKE